MERIEVFPDKSPASRATTQTTRQMRPAWDLLAILFLVVLSFPANWLSPRSLTITPFPGMFDDHWVYDTVFKASRGIVFGRDVAFPYGPSFQWLASAPARWTGLSMGSVPGLFHTLLLWSTYLCGYLSLRLLLPKQQAWKRFLLLLLLCVFWAPWDARATIDVFLFALFLRGRYEVGEHRVRAGIFGLGSAFLCVLAFLYSADTGIYSTAALIASLIGVGWESRRRERAYLRLSLALAAFLVTFGILVLVVNVLLGGLLDFHFWKNSLALVAVHRWNEPSSMSGYNLALLLTASLFGATIFLVRLLVSDSSHSIITARSGFLLGAFLLTAALIQSGLVRSDSNHIAFALYPIVFFSSAVLFSFPSRVLSIIAALFVTACSLLFGLPAPVYGGLNLRYRYNLIRNPITICPAGFTEFDSACFPSSFSARLYGATNYVQQHSRPDDYVLLFPYQYMYGFASGRSVAGGVLQSFLAAGTYLAGVDIDGMKQSAAPVGLYFPDGKANQTLDPDRSLSIDNVPNFTRTPTVWLWIFRHYQSEQELFPGVPALLKDDSRANRIGMQAQSLISAAQTFLTHARSSVFDLGGLSPLPSAGDFLRLRINVRYNLLWKLRKPARLQLEIIRSDGSDDLVSFVVEPNVSSEIWFYPWEQVGLAAYFSPDEHRWRAAARPAIDRLRLRVTPFDWVSQQPISITVEAADVVTFHMEKSLVQEMPGRAVE